MTELPKQYKTEYYYIDYVEYGKTIENIPPEPTVKGYKFNGWYTEADCINKWNFENTLSQLDKDEDFNELCLYAKWIKDSFLLCLINIFSFHHIFSDIYPLFIII